MEILTLSLFAPAPSHQYSITLLTSAGQQLRFTGGVSMIGSPRGTFDTAEDIATLMPFRNAKVMTTDLSILSPDEVQASVEKWIRTKVRAGFQDAHLMSSEIPDDLLLSDPTISSMLNKYREKPIGPIPERKKLTEFIRQHRKNSNREGSMPVSVAFQERMAEMANFFVDDHHTGFDYDLFFYDATIPNPIRNAKP